MSISVWRIGFNQSLTHASLAVGSTLSNGRWHLAPNQGGSAVVYAASSRALAQLEKRVHANGVFPVDQALMRIELPAKTIVQDARADLSPDWIQNEAATQAFGTQWLHQAKALAIWVPSAVEPRESNMLINPVHPRFASLKIILEDGDFRFDSRLFS